MKIHRKNEGKLSTTNGCRCVWLRPQRQFVTTANAARGEGAGVPRGQGHCCSLWFSSGSMKKKKRIPKFYCYTRKITTGKGAWREWGGGGGQGRTRQLQGVAFWLRFRFRRSRWSLSQVQVEVEAYRRRLPGKVKGTRRKELNPKRGNTARRKL